MNFKINTRIQVPARKIHQKHNKLKYEITGRFIKLLLQLQTIWRIFSNCKSLLVCSYALRSTKLNKVNNDCVNFMI